MGGLDVAVFGPLPAKNRERHTFAFSSGEQPRTRVFFGRWRLLRLRSSRFSGREQRRSAGKDQHDDQTEEMLADRMEHFPSLADYSEWSATRLPSLSMTIARNPKGPIACFGLITLPPFAATAPTASSSRPLAFK